MMCRTCHLRTNSDKANDARNTAGFGFVFGAAGSPEPLAPLPEAIMRSVRFRPTLDPSFVFGAEEVHAPRGTSRTSTATLITRVQETPAMKASVPRTPNTLLQLCCAVIAANVEHINKLVHLCPFLKGGLWADESIGCCASPQRNLFV